MLCCKKNTAFLFYFIPALNVLSENFLYIVLHIIIGAGYFCTQFSLAYLP